MLSFFVAIHWFLCDPAETTSQSLLFCILLPASYKETSERLSSKGPSKGPTQEGKSWILPGVYRKR